jgi:hypothetical protein
MKARQGKVAAGARPAKLFGQFMQVSFAPSSDFSIRQSPGGAAYPVVPGIGEDGARGRSESR